MAGKVRSVAVVGHGPSLLQMNAGEEIDKHDLVVRMKWHRSLTEQPEKFGAKTDIVSCSWVVSPNVQAHWPDIKHFFIFSDSRTQDKTYSDVRRTLTGFGDKIAVLDKPLCDFWDDRYRVQRDRTCTPGHDHTSAGWHTLMYVGKYLAPCEVSLYGFDSVATGDWTWSVTRGPDWDRYPDHRFDVEHAMLPELTAAYMMDIRAYMPDGVVIK